MNLEFHLKEIARLKREADKLPDDVPQALLEKIDLLSNCFEFIGRLSSFLDGEYKRIYGRRKLEYAKAVTEAKRDKQAFAEIAVKELREEEAEAYEMMQRWRNAFESTKEEIHVKKLKLRIDFEDGTKSNVRITA